MTPADHLLLEAKQAILDEQHRRFKALQAEGRLEEAWRQFHVTLGCASDLLNHSLSLLEAITKHRPRRDQDSV
jgi:hypothetical protein